MGSIKEVDVAEEVPEGILDEVGDLVSPVVTGVL